MSYDGQGMTYDYSGNLTEYGMRAFGWTEYNQLSTIAEWYRDEEGNRVRRRIDYTYDTSGIRTSKTVDGVKTEYFYVGDKLVKQSTDGVPDNDLYFSYSADGSPFCVNYDGTNYYYLLNLQGDVIGLYIANGTVVVSYVYDSWGKLISSQTTSDRYDTLAEINPLRYRSYVYDNETQLYYLQARYYNPEWGRFINADSLLVAGDYLQGLNRYAYCFNNPICYSDPSGYATVDGVVASYDLSNPVTLVLAVFLSPYICLDSKDGLGMSIDTFARFIVEADSLSDIYHLSLVMLSGKNNDKSSDTQFIGINSFNVCPSLTSKFICELVAEYYYQNNIQGVDGAILSKEYLAQEIYAHAITFYYSDDVLGIINTLDNDFNNIYPGYNLMKPAFTHIIGRANPINLGGEGTFDKLGVVLFPLIWDYF